MKFVKIYLSMVFVFSFISGVFSMERENTDPELAEVLKTMVSNLNYIPNPRFPNLPTETDIQYLEDRLFKPGCKLPHSLKQYHLTCGNRIFEGGVRFPTVHQKENAGCNLLDFIREGHDKGVPFIQEGQAKEALLGNWLAFGEDESAYVCMEVQTQKVCYFSFVPNLKKDKKEYENLSSWIKERLLSQ